MCNVEYTSDFEFDLDISFGVRETLLDYGIGVDYNEHNITCERITYNLDFYEDKELRLKLSEIFNFERDPFSVVREVYDDDDNKDTAIYHITEYVRKYAKSCSLSYFKKREPNKTLKDNYNERLKNYGEDMTIKESTNKTDSFAHNIGVQLWQMTNAAHSIASDDNVSDELAMAAETALQSLLKSMAIYGYNLVDGDK